MVGAGAAGLAAAALLRKRGFQTIVLERTEAVGARWRTRYDGLRLNTMRTHHGFGGAQPPNTRSSSIATAIETWSRPGAAATCTPSGSPREPRPRGT